MANIKRYSGGYTKPKWSIYDVLENPEYRLSESVAVEFCDIVGMKMWYYAQDGTITPDKLYGETQNRAYLNGKESKVIYDVAEIPTVYSMFGMIATDQVVAHMPQATYRRDISNTLVPKVGDILIFEWYRDVTKFDVLQGRTFEIIHAAEDQNIFQLRSLVYSFYLIPYRFSEESDSARALSSDLPTATPSITAFGDNDWIDTQSEAIDSYSDVDASIYKVE